MYVRFDKSWPRQASIPLPLIFAYDTDTVYNIKIEDTLSGTAASSWWPAENAHAVINNMRYIYFYRINIIYCVTTR